MQYNHAESFWSSLMNYKVFDFMHTTIIMKMKHAEALALLSFSLPSKQNTEKQYHLVHTTCLVSSVDSPGGQRRSWAFSMSWSIMWGGHPDSLRDRRITACWEDWSLWLTADLFVWHLNQTSSLLMLISRNLTYWPWQETRIKEPVLFCLCIWFLGAPDLLSSHSSLV